MTKQRNNEDISFAVDMASMMCDIQLYNIVIKILPVSHTSAVSEMQIQLQLIGISFWLILMSLFTVAINKQWINLGETILFSFISDGFTTFQFLNTFSASCN